MKTLPIDAKEEEIRTLVIEWNELLAQEKYAEAIDFILYDNTQERDGKIWIWTPGNLEASVFTYGMPWFSKEEIEKQYGAGSADYKVSSLLQLPKDELWDEIEISIQHFDETVSSEKARMWGISGLDYENIIGEVLYDGVPLNGERSDLTALFWIKKVGERDITLVFRDLHVM